jgi:hypothetical protein
MDASGNRFSILLLSYPGQGIRHAVLAGWDGYPTPIDAPLDQCG